MIGSSNLHQIRGASGPYANSTHRNTEKDDSGSSLSSSDSDYLFQRDT